MTTLSIRELSVEEYSDVAGGAGLVAEVLKGFFVELLVNGSVYVGEQIIEWYNTRSEAAKAELDAQANRPCLPPRCVQGKITIEPPPQDGDYDTFEI